MADADLDYAKFTGRLALTVGDGDDTGDNPDTIWCDGGEVVIRPLTSYVKVVGAAGGPFTAGQGAVTATVAGDGFITFNGKPYVWVVDLTSSKVNPVIGSNKATHQITFRNVTAQGLPVTFESVYVRITAAGTDGAGSNDLTALAPVATAPSQPIYRGETGPEGPPGPGASDEDVAAYVGTPGTATADALSATFASLNGDGELVVNGVVVETGSNLEGTAPVSARIDIVTAGKAPIVSKVDYLSATIAVTGVPGVADYAGLCQIRGRGNYTWSLAKKPYKLKFAATVSLMGMPAFNDWALLANHTDPSKINNALAFALGAQADGLDWTPSSEYAHTYLNGEYVGLYQLTETVKRGSVRVAIDKAGTTGLALTGGYMLEGDENYVAFGDPGFTTTNDVKIIFDDPDGAVTGQADYIVAKVQEFEDVLFGSSWLDPTTGYARFIDRDSFIDHYLIEELSSNQEGAWNSSQKFYKTRDTDTVPGRFFMGPLWDFDIAFGSEVNALHPAVGYFARPGAKWIERMFQDPTFRTAVTVRWTAMAARLNDTATGYAATIDTLTARVASAALADQERWAYTADWSALAVLKKSWLATRIAWLTSVLAPTSAPTSAPADLGATPTDTEVVLSWTAVTAADDYTVQYRLVGAGSWTTFADGFSTATSATVTGLTPQNAYEFQVAGSNSLGTGPFAPASATTGAASSVVFVDHFDRADSTSTLGASWVALDGTWGIAGNQAYAPAIGAVATAPGVVTANDYEVSILVPVMGDPDYGLGIAARVQDADNYYVMLFGTNAGGITLYKKQGGTFTVIGLLATNSPPPAVEVGLRVVGNTFQARVAGSLDSTVLTDSTFTTGRPGLRTDSVDTRIDDFSVSSA